MRINNVGLNLGQKSNNPFKTSRNSSTNPFQNVSFEGNTLPYADVFVGGIETKKTNKLKMIASSVAGSMTKVRSAFEPIVNFVNRIGEGISNAWNFTWNKTLFTLPGEETCRKVMNADIVDIGKGIGDVLSKDALEVGKDISKKLGITHGISTIGNLGNGISEKWGALISNLKNNHAPKISKDIPVDDLKAMWINENALMAERVAA